MNATRAKKFKFYTPAANPLELVGDEPYVISNASDYPIEKRLQAVKNWGAGTHSFLSLYPDVRYFRVPGIEGFIPLSISDKLILVVGQPICAPESFKILTRALQYYAAKVNCAIAAIPTSKESEKQFKASGFRSFYIGRDPIFDLKNLAKPCRSIRQAVNRAKRKGLKLVTYHERYRTQIEELSKKWEDGRELPPMGFLFSLRPLELHRYKKYFLVVDSEDKLQAYLACSPIYEKNGWYLEDLIRDQTAPNGCTELLVTETLRMLAMEGYSMATLGLSPLSGMEGRNPEHPIINAMMKFSFNNLSSVYHFKALEHFKSKFKPAYWEDNYFCHYRAGSIMVLVANMFAAFAPFDWGAVVKHKFRKLSH